MDWNYVVNLVKTISNLGRSGNPPSLAHIEPFRVYHTKHGKIDYKNIDERDGKFSRREIITRYLLTNIVLDQGPDPVGIGQMLGEVTKYLYRNEIRIFHKPIDFFREFNVSIDEIWKRHGLIRKSKIAEAWACNNETDVSRYNLFFAQSTRGIIPNQILDYVVHRWGVPLCLFVLLEQDMERKGEISSQPLVDYLEASDSAEIMTWDLKGHERYGLGNAIGNKACHLFAKIYVDVYNLVKHRHKDGGWHTFSYEPPLDSNAGRVLFRTGFLFEFASPNEYEDRKVIQKSKKRGGTHYIRVTNIRGMKTSQIKKDSKEYNVYNNIKLNYMKIGSRFTQIEIQRIPNIIIYELNDRGYNYTLADFDDGLMHVGTNYCYNNPKPKCRRCPLRKMCQGHQGNKGLITRYAT